MVPSSGFELIFVTYRSQLHCIKGSWHLCFLLSFQPVITVKVDGCPDKRHRVLTLVNGTNLLAHFALIIIILGIIANIRVKLEVLIVLVDLLRGIRILDILLAIVVIRDITPIENYLVEGIDQLLLVLFVYWLIVLVDVRRTLNLNHGQSVRHDQVADHGQGLGHVVHYVDRECELGVDGAVLARQVADPLR